MENQTISIKSFKLISKGKLKGVEVTYKRRFVDATGAIAEVDAPKELHKVEPHPDLVALMRKLSPHYQCVLEHAEYSPKEVASKKTVDQWADVFPVRGVIFKDGSEWSGVMMSGNRKLQRATR